MASETGNPVVSVDWLKEVLDNNTPDIRILDATWSSKDDTHASFLQQHIPGAQFFDIMKDVVHSDIYPRNFPDASTFEKYAQALGISAKTHVVLYDNTGQGGFFTAGRAWWLLKLYGHERVSVLNGGLGAWLKAGYPTTSDLESVTRGDFAASYDSSYMTKRDVMAENLQSHNLQVLDSRADAIYRGKKEDAKTGHYPGAVNIPFHAQLLDDKTNTLKSPEELKQVFSAAGVDFNRPIATMCNSGMSSCTLALATQLAGGKAAVYHGGFNEWSKLGDESQIEQS